MQIDWTREPQDQLEKGLSWRCHLAALRFLRQITDPVVVERYAGQERAITLGKVQRPIILNAYDSLGLGETVVASDEDVPGEFLEEHGIDWGYISQAINALQAVQAIDFVSEGSNGHQYEFKASNLITEYEEPGEDFDYSKPLDVHTWSEHPEVNLFVNEIYDAHFGVPAGRKKIKRDSVKNLLLDLYVTWSIDPKLKIGMSRNENVYKARTGGQANRYNKLFLTKSIIKAADKLEEVNLINIKMGFRDSDTGRGFQSRIWPTEALIEKFNDARFSPMDIDPHWGEECIILKELKTKYVTENGVRKKKTDNVPKQYLDNANTKRMRKVLIAYNDLLRHTYIDIPTLDEPFVELGSNVQGKPIHLSVNQADKYVRRIFNRGSWKKGGRFWGGWWQRCPKVWRRYDPEAGQPGIFIDDKPTSELDYSGMHIVMLYAQVGIDYWADIGGDTYTIDLPDFGFEPEQLRTICKGLVLVALNARDDASSFKAFRDNADTGSLEKSLKDNQLKPILDKLREKHAPIADKFATDQGIDLMRQDSNITEHIIKHFTGEQIPILTIHDSYIIWDGYEDELDRVMKEAFEAEMNVPRVQLKRENKTSSEILDEHFARRGMDMRNPALQTELRFAHDQRVDPQRTERYRHHYEQFQEWLAGDAEAQSDG